MKFKSRQAPPESPSVTGTARVGTPTSSLLPRLRPGDIAVIDHIDLDRDTATTLVDSGIVAVVNASPMISGRYANLGPEVLAEAGVVVVDRIGPEGLDRIQDDQQIRVHDGAVYIEGPDGSPEKLVAGRTFDADSVLPKLDETRPGLDAQLDLLAHTTREFLRREQELVLNGRGLPDLVTRLAGRPVVVVAHAEHADLQALRPFVREQAPVILAVGAAADDVLGVSWAPDVLVVTAGDPASVPSLDALRVATDVVLLAPRGSSLQEQAHIEAAGVVPLVVESSAAAEDVALLLADRHDAGLVVGVGLHTRLEEFLDQQRAGHASSFATRLKIGSRLVDASAVRLLYTTRARPIQVVLVLLAGLVALLAAIAVTPVGQEWAGDISDYLQGLT